MSITKGFLYVIVFVWGISFWAWSAEVPQDATVLNLSATARQTVLPDVLTLSLRIEKEADSPQDVQRYINEHMQMAIKRAEKLDDVESSTGHYNVNERWMYKGDNRKDRVRHWHGSQELILKGKEIERMLQLAATLQSDGFAMNNASYSVSRPVQEGFKDALVAEALGTIQQRARKIAAQLGKAKVHLAQVNVQGEFPNYPRPMMMRAEMAAMDGMAEAVQAPVAKASSTELEVSVSAEIWLQQ